jgi:hypothetical protein
MAPLFVTTGMFAAEDTCAANGSIAIATPSVR